MHVVKIWIFLFLTLASNSLCERIECHWEAEYLCGDKCLGIDNLCLCGNETITYADYNYICCNEKACFKELDGNVRCDGLKQGWWVPCNGLCKQFAYSGYTTIACADLKQCVQAEVLCRGVPFCHE